MNLFIKQLPCQLKNALVSVICHFSSFNFGVMNLSLQIFYFFFCRLFSEVWKKYNIGFTHLPLLNVSLL